MQNFRSISLFYFHSLLKNDRTGIGSFIHKVHSSSNDFYDTFRRYTFRLEAGAPETLPVDGKLYHSAVIRGSGETYSFADEAYVGGWLTRSGIAYSDLKSEKMNLEDAFIGLTGKY